MGSYVLLPSSLHFMQAAPPTIWAGTERNGAVMRSRHNIVVVGGCGHVGLPLGIVLAAKAGADVWLLDIDPAKVEMTNNGRMPFLERGADQLLRQVIGKNLRATMD